MLLIAPVGGVPAGHDPLDRRTRRRREHFSQLLRAVPVRHRIHSTYRPLRVHGLDCIGGRELGPDAAARSSVTELRRRDVELFIARLHYPARVVLEKAGFTDALGPGHVWHSISQTVKAASLYINGEPLPEVDDAVAWDLESGPQDPGSTG